MVLINTSVEDDVMDAALESSKTFFLSSQELKLTAASANDKNYRGYEVCGTGKEAWEMGLELPAQDLPLHGPNRWPQHADAVSFRRNISAYYQQLLEFTQILLRGFCLALGLSDDFMDDAISSPLAHLRLWHYAKSDSDGSLPEHTDHGFLTLLLQDGGGGLQARNRAGDWVNVPTMPHSLVINTGRLLSRWTNDLYSATYHRVVNRTDADRFSLPLFFAPDYHFTVAPLPCCVTDSTASKYDNKPVVCGEYISAGYAWQGAVNTGQESAADAAAKAGAEYKEHCKVAAPPEPPEPELKKGEEGRSEEEQSGI
jgi:isopenicillin N synthase-like dioxygenase